VSAEALAKEEATRPPRQRLLATNIPESAEALAKEEATHPPSSGVPQVDILFHLPSSKFPLHHPDAATWPSLLSIPNSRFSIPQSPSVPPIPLSDLFFH